MLIILINETFVLISKEDADVAVPPSSRTSVIPQYPACHGRKLNGIEADPGCTDTYLSRDWCHKVLHQSHGSFAAPTKHVVACGE